MFLYSRGARELSQLSNGVSRFLRSLYYSTTISHEASKPYFMVDYLINALGFSRAAAISTSTKVPHLKSPKNPDLVLNIFRQYGLENPQIREIVSSVPTILIYKANKTLEPKIRVLTELGLSGSDLVDLIKRNPYFLRVGLDTQLIPVIDHLRKILRSDEKVISVVNRGTWLFSSYSLKRFLANVVLLRDRGLSDEKIMNFITQRPRILTLNPACLEAQLRWIVEELGVPQNSRMFIHAINGVSMSSRSTLSKKFAVFRSYGWSDPEIIKFGKTQPACLAISEAKIRNGLDFLMKELGHTPAFLASCPSLLGMSLEKRVKPRYEVWEKLVEKKLVGGRPAFTTVLAFSEPKFQAFVRRFEGEIPDVIETYLDTIKKAAIFKNSQTQSTRAGYDPKR